MGKLSKLVENVKKVDYSKLLDDTFRETEDALIEILQSQLEMGEKGDGEMPEYSQESGSRLYKGKELINLYDTGDFHKGFFVTQNKYSLRIRSRDSKNKILMSEYGVEIFELNGENKDEYIYRHVLPIFKKKLRDGLLR